MASLAPQFVLGFPCSSVRKAFACNAGGRDSQEDPLEKEMATHSSILAWRIPWLKEPGRLQSIGSQMSDRIEWLKCVPVYRHTYRCIVLMQQSLVTWTFLVVWLVKNPPAMWEAWVRSLGWEDPLEKGKGYPLQYFGPENSMDCIVHGIEKSWTQLRDFNFTSLQLHVAI